MFINEFAGPGLVSCFDRFEHLAMILNDLDILHSFYRKSSDSVEMKHHRGSYLIYQILFCYAVDQTVEFIIQTKDLIRHNLLQIEFLKLYVFFHDRDITFGCRITCYLDHFRIENTSQESGFLYHIRIDQRYETAPLGIYLYNRNLDQIRECFAYRSSGNPHQVSKFVFADSRSGLKFTGNDIFF